MSHWTAVVAARGCPLPPGRDARAAGPDGSGRGRWPPRRPGCARPHRRRPRCRPSGSRGLPVTTPGPDLAATWPRTGPSVAELVVVGDAMLRAGACSPRPTLAGARRPPATSWRGVRAARRGARRCWTGAPSRRWSPGCGCCWSLAGLPAPDVAARRHPRAARFVARVDLAWPEQRLVVEYDGDAPPRPRQRVADLRRREALERARLDGRRADGRGRPGRPGRTRRPRRRAPRLTPTADRAPMTATRHGPGGPLAPDCLLDGAGRRAAGRGPGRRARPAAHPPRATPVASGGRPTLADDVRRVVRPPPRPHRVLDARRRGAHRRAVRRDRAAGHDARSP